MTPTGDFAVYAPNNNNPLWRSNTAGNPGAWLSCQDDGSVVIFGPKGNPIWSTASGEFVPDVQAIRNLLSKFSVLFSAIARSIAQGNLKLWSVPLNAIGIQGALPLGWEVCLDRADALAIKNSIDKYTQE
jgi:hypothetical protein